MMITPMWAEFSSYPNYKSYLTTQYCTGTRHWHGSGRHSCSSLANCQIGVDNRWEEIWANAADMCQ